MKLFAILAAAALTVAAQSQPTVFKRNAINAATTPTVSANFQNIGQSVHIMMAYFPSAVADVSGFTLRLEASFDNTTFFPISEDLTTAVYTGSYAYAITRANGVYPYVRMNLTAAHASLALTAHYTGAIQPIGLVRLSGTRYVIDSPLSGATYEGLCITIGGNCYVNGRRMTPIIPSQWTSVNLASSTVRTDGSNSIFLDSGFGAGTGWNFVCQNLPSASNYHIRVHYMRTSGSAAGDNPAQTGVILRNSSTGAFIAHYLWAFDTYVIAKWTNPTTENSQYLNNPSRLLGELYSVDLTDDGTNRIWRWWDGFNTYREYQGTAETQGRTDFTTPNQICFGNYESNGNYRTQARLIGYDVNPTW